MAGYIGTKAVALSTTTGNILGDMTVGGTTDVATLEFNSLSGTGAVTITDILDEDNLASNSATKLATQQSIKAYVDSQVDTVDTLAEILAVGNRTSGAGKIEFRDAAIYLNSSEDGQLDIVANTEIQLAATTVDLNGNLDVSGTTVSAGNLLMGMASDSVTGTGVGLIKNGISHIYAGDFTADTGGPPLMVGRGTNDGPIIEFNRSGTTGGGINIDGGSLVIGGDDVGIGFYQAANAIVPYNQATNQARGDEIDIGINTIRWKDVYLSGNIIPDAGKGIDFSATSDGAGTDVSSVLNDYEEGQFSPVLTVAGSATGMTQNITIGRYIKVGRKVTCWLHLRLTDKGSGTGHVRIQGFPYAASDLDSSDEAAAGVCAFWHQLATAVTPGGYMQKGTSELILIDNAASTASPSLGQGPLNNDSSFYYTVIYNAVAV